MRYEEFQRLAIASLVGRQEENGSWLNDEAATCAALEVLLEDMFGPLASWRHSWIGSHVRGHGINSWPLMFSYGPTTREEGVSEQKLAAVWNGISFGCARLDKSNLWLSIKWNNLFSFIDFDARPDSHALEEASTNVKSEDPWLLAQLAKYFLFADRAYIDRKYQLERCHVLIPLIRQLISSAESDHWTSKNLSLEETTAIVSQFLFHPGVPIFLEEIRNEESKTMDKRWLQELDSLRASVFSWIRSRQSSEGSWEGSPAITTHCVEALITSLENREGLDTISDENKTVVVRAIEWLLSDQVITWWDNLRSYEQIQTLLLLKKLSSVGRFKGIRLGNAPFSAAAFSGALEL
jgi:hypothetical protein